MTKTLTFNHEVQKPDIFKQNIEHLYSHFRKRQALCAAVLLEIPLRYCEVPGRRQSIVLESSSLESSSQ